MKTPTLFFLFLLFAVGCGVKGDPLPPLVGPNIGRGKPTFKRAAKELNVNDLKKEGRDLEEDEEGEVDENADE